MILSLPHDCILLIVNFLITPYKNVRHRRNLKNWKNIPTNSVIRNYWELDASLKNNMWRLPSFISIIPLLQVSNGTKEIFSSDDIWTYIYEHEFRNSKPFKRRPLNVYKKTISKSKEIIKKRYHPIIEYGEKQIILIKEELKKNLTQIHLIDKSLLVTTVRDKGVGSSYWWYENIVQYNIDDYINSIHQVRSLHIELPKGFIEPYSSTPLETPRRTSLHRIEQIRGYYKRYSERAMKKLHHMTIDIIMAKKTYSNCDS